MRHALTAVAVLALAAACASPGLPPGGPTISALPRVIATLPDTNAVNVRPSKVLVRYDDVIGENANGGALSRAVLISPWDGEPRVEWRRTGMAIRPKGAWRTNTAYTVTILPGVTDLKGKPIPNAYVLQFSTGPTIPTSVIRGATFDWVQNKPLPRATVQAIDVTDTTLVYLTVADSTGRYELGAVPPGRYLVRAIDEKTPNRALEPREPWDAVTIVLSDSARSDLYLFVHDTIAPRISELRLTDSVTISLQMDKPLAVGLTIPLANVRVTAADSTPIAVTSIMTAEEARVAQALADSLARAKDSTQRAPDVPPAARRTIDPTRKRDTVATVPPPVATRRQPSTELIVRMATPLPKGATYRVTVNGLRNLLGIDGSSTRVLIVAKPLPVDSTRTPAPRTPPAVPPGAAAPRPAPPATSDARPTRPPR